MDTELALSSPAVGSHASVTSLMPVEDVDLLVRISPLSDEGKPEVATRVAVLLKKAWAHEKYAHRLRRAVRFAKYLNVQSRDGLDDVVVVDCLPWLRPAGVCLDEELPLFGCPVRAAEREARAHEDLARFLTDAALRDLGVLSCWDDGETFVVESSPCGLTRLRCAIVPRPPTARAVLNVTVEYALAA
ncbi:hypothetical protein [Streptomyces sp. bgisy060]|uniref:hypothetical protein n=1 Tax=Streptomyces sp. bgisy060 TaxID=3413775 RepID=UPI003EBECF63